MRGFPALSEKKKYSREAKSSTRKTTFQTTARTLSAVSPPGSAAGLSGLIEALICGMMSRIWFLNARPAATPTKRPLMIVLSQNHLFES
jgi:hypothetical protein